MRAYRDSGADIRAVMQSAVQLGLLQGRPLQAGQVPGEFIAGTLKLTGESPRGRAGPGGLDKASIVDGAEPDGPADG